MSNIEESILSRVKSELGLVGEIDNEKLLKMLSAARVAKHPDKYTDEGAKKKAEEDFKRMDNLLLNFQVYIEQEKAKMPSSELMLYDEKYNKINEANEVIALHNKIYELTDQIKEIKRDNGFLKSDKESLTKQIEELLIKEVEENNDELKEIYKPSKKAKYASIISLSILIISNIEVVKYKISEIISIPDSYINWIFGAILIIAIISLIYRHCSSVRLENFKNKLSSTRFLMNHLRINMKGETWKEYFILESKIEDLIRFEINRYKSDRFLFYTKKEEIVKDIKKYVISILLEKKLMIIGSATGFDRKFKVQPADNSALL